MFSSRLSDVSGTYFSRLPFEILDIIADTAAHVEESVYKAAHKEKFLDVLRPMRMIIQHLHRDIENMPGYGDEFNYYDPPDVLIIDEDDIPLYNRWKVKNRKNWDFTLYERLTLRYGTRTVHDKRILAAAKKLEVNTDEITSPGNPERLILRLYAGFFKFASKNMGRDHRDVVYFMTYPAPRVFICDISSEEYSTSEITGRLLGKDFVENKEVVAYSYRYFAEYMSNLKRLGRKKTEEIYGRQRYSSLNIVRCTVFANDRALHRLFL